MPAVEGPLHERHVVGMFEVRLADQPRLTMRATPVVRQAELLDAQHARPASREVIERGAADAADSQHDGVKGLHTQFFAR